MKKTFMIGPKRKGRGVSKIMPKFSIKNEEANFLKVGQIISNGTFEEDVNDNWENDLQENKEYLNLILGESRKISQNIQAIKNSVDILAQKAGLEKGIAEKTKDVLDYISQIYANWSFKIMTKTVQNCPLWNNTKDGR